jgi:hypothetical protein
MVLVFGWYYGKHGDAMHLGIVLTLLDNHYNRAVSTSESFNT